jgi:23S rRNA (guanosine2251-2'-O)-methyltransferase
MRRVLAGPRAVAEALRSAQANTIAVIYVAPDGNRELDDLLGRARGRRIPVEERPSSFLDAHADGLRHQGVVAVAGDYAYTTVEDMINRSPASPLFVALDEITDPHNLGAIVRSAVAFGVGGIILPKDRAAHVTGAVVRASAGATEHASIARVTNLARTLDTLRAHGFEVIGLDAMGATTLDALDPADSGRVLVVGSEGRGLRPNVRRRCDVLARIPMAGPIGSLNASVAAAIAVYTLVHSSAAAD